MTVNKSFCSIMHKILIDPIYKTKNLKRYVDLEILLFIWPIKKAKCGYKKNIKRLGINEVYTRKHK
ncbi:hypothetical protein GCM10020331_098220 [Ectobacillus funiculus]